MDEDEADDWEDEDEDQEDEHRGPTVAEVLLSLMRRAQTPAPLPRPAAPAPQPAVRPVRAPRPAAPARPVPARPPAPEPTPWERLQEERRRDSASSLVRSLPGSFLYVWYDQPAGACEVLDVNKLPPEQRCPAPRTHAVVMKAPAWEQTHAYACSTHAVQLAAHVERYPGLTAVAYPLRKK